MDSEKLYRVQEEDLSKLEELLCRSFAADPLYVELIPDEEVRKRLMPELFQCDLTEFYETCEIFADSKDLNGILVVSDETEPYHLLHRYFTEVQATLRTEGYLIREDHTVCLKTWQEKSHHWGEAICLSPRSICRDSPSKPASRRRI